MRLIPLPPSSSACHSPAPTIKTLAVVHFAPPLSLQPANRAVQPRTAILTRANAVTPPTFNMKHIFALAAVLFTASAAAQSTTIKPGAVTSAVAPKSSPPPGCSENYDGVFEIGPINVTSSSSKRSLLEVVSLTIDKPLARLDDSTNNSSATNPKHSAGHHAEKWYLDRPSWPHGLHCFQSAIPV